VYVDGGVSTVQPDDHAPPFGYPVLAEVPELAAVLTLATDLDVLHRRLIGSLAELHAAGLVETATGVDVELWLATVARVTRSDRRMLATTVKVLCRLPHLARCYRDGALSWSQLRTVVLKVHRLPSRLDEQVDTGLAGVIEACAGVEPDELARQVDWLLATLTDDEGQDDPGAAVPWLHLQPRLDGSGGTVNGDLDAVGFAAVDATTAPTRGELAGLASSRSDAVGASPAPDPDAPGPGVRRLPQLRAAKLTDALLAATTGTAGTAPDDTAGTADATEATAGRRGRGIGMLLRVELAALLDGSLPAQLLTTLAGGAMHVDAATAAQLADRYGTRLRLIVTDQGRAVGVGRATHRPPGWVRDAVLSSFDTCAEPGCLRAARACDFDHALTWTDGGRTDVDNLAPLCATSNRGRDRTRWEVTQHGDGTRVWRHRRTGLTTATVPATWRPRSATGPSTPCRCGGCTCDRDLASEPSSSHRRRAGPVLTGHDRPCYRTDRVEPGPQAGPQRADRQPRAPDHT
jgi:hypothetical protein